VSRDLNEMSRRSIPFCILVAAGLSIASPASAVIVYHVNDAGDTPDVNTSDGVCETAAPGICTLRAAVQQANVTGGTIVVPAMTITLTDVIPIEHDMSILGAGMHSTVISGNGVHQNFTIPGAGVTVSISDVTLRDGNGGAGGSTGGAIYLGTGQLTIERCSFANDYAGFGGAVFGDLGSDPRIHDSEFTDDHAPAGTGGAIFVFEGVLTVSGSAIHGNSASSGAGLAVSGGTGTVTNSTIGQNTADTDGGGIALFKTQDGGASIYLYSTTVARNRATTGAGAGIFVQDSTSVAAIQNTIVANNTRIGKGAVVSSDCSGTLASGGNSIVPGICTEVTGSYSTADPLLGPLQDNGGASGPTYALGSGSPAIDGGSVGGCPLTDQRGVRRQTGVACDVGAYEHAPCGDADGDGTVGLADVFFVINFLFAGGTKPPGLANVNGDGVVDVSDVFFLINSLFASGPAPTCAGT
jgi:Right handed beta helix region/Dockerin type I domain